MERSALWNEFNTLNKRKRLNPRALSPIELSRWRRLRLEIESILYVRTNSPIRDSREHLRIPSNLTVFFHAGGKLEQKPMTNVGEGGCFICHPEPQKNGLELVMALVLPRIADCLNLRGRIVWKTQKAGNSGMGVQFVDLKPEHEATLFHFIDGLIVNSLG